MKKYGIGFLMLLTLLGCSQSEEQRQKELAYKRAFYLWASEELNERCLDIKYFQIYQVIENGYALANACNFKGVCDYDKIYLLRKQKNMDYYDNMTVSIDDASCAVIDKTFRFPNYYGIIRTVPIIRLESIRQMKSKGDMNEFIDAVEKTRHQDCDFYAALNNEKEDKYCHCKIEVEYQRLREELKEGFSTSSKESEKIIEKRLAQKCGHLQKNTKTNSYKTAQKTKKTSSTPKETK